uniref:Nudix hydrolase domain-containing protein n=1 Tax=Chromera velia CCMP2878 TaxID=1169474 RepID=A0A0G4GB36_9ALVE|eukprot:Cvel_21026.t1-p1 / transcript=Cvel_21026.t1 / gene=Cvel_21026 / organism=Chromera_velia_CCMP2878 / gene_product=hypothetical protein / transcript_product=hypothetical protein / location=Cvel_scaffold1938:31701-33516(+) / protein_length=306 / sequence_SO=supercontig / SO=protein_coding / is_pseudo=false
MLLWKSFHLPPLLLWTVSSTVYAVARHEPLSSEGPLNLLDRSPPVAGAGVIAPEFLALGEALGTRPAGDRTRGQLLTDAGEGVKPSNRDLIGVFLFRPVSSGSAALEVLMVSNFQENWAREGLRFSFPVGSIDEDAESLQTAALQTALNSAGVTQGDPSGECLDDFLPIHLPPTENGTVPIDSLLPPVSEEGHEPPRLSVVAVEVKETKEWKEVDDSVVRMRAWFPVQDGRPEGKGVSVDPVGGGVQQRLGKFGKVLLHRPAVSSSENRVDLDIDEGGVFSSRNRNFRGNPLDWIGAFQRQKALPR